MDIRIDSEDANYSFKQLEETQYNNELEHLKKENFRLMELIIYLQKDGYTYNQVNRKIFICDVCHKNLIKDENETTPIN